MGFNRRRRRSPRCGTEMDDRGWTVLHIGACKGDVKEVVLFSLCTSDCCVYH